MKRSINNVQRQLDFHKKLCKSNLTKIKLLKIDIVDFRNERFKIISLENSKQTAAMKIQAGNLEKLMVFLSKKSGHLILKTDEKNHNSIALRKCCGQENPRKVS